MRSKKIFLLVCVIVMWQGAAIGQSKLSQIPEGTQIEISGKKAFKKAGKKGNKKGEAFSGSSTQSCTTPAPQPAPTQVQYVTTAVTPVPQPVVQQRVIVYQRPSFQAAVPIGYRFARNVDYFLHHAHGPRPHWQQTRWHTGINWGTTYNSHCRQFCH